MYINMYIYINIHAHIYTYRYVYIHTHTWMYVYIHMYIHIHMYYIYSYVHIYIHIHTYIHMNMYVCVYICIHTYTYTYKQDRLWSVADFDLICGIRAPASSPHRGHPQHQLSNPRKFQTHTRTHTPHETRKPLRKLGPWLRQQKQT